MAIAMLDVVSHGRAGWQPRISATAARGRAVRQADVEGARLFAEAADAVEVVRGLWDDAVAPRPPQGQPVVAALAHDRRVYEFASRSADLVFITPKDDEQLSAILREVDDAGGARLRVYADVFVASRSASPIPARTPTYSSGSRGRTGRPAAAVANLGVDGLRLRPVVNAIDLPSIVDEVMPLLRAAAGSVPPTSTARRCATPRAARGARLDIRRWCRRDRARRPVHPRPLAHQRGR